MEENKEIDIIRKEKNGYCTIRLSFKEDLSGFFPFAHFEFSGEPVYSFVGGMFYTDKKEFDLNEKLNLSFPYTSYYKFRIPPLRRDGKFYKSLIYVKMPVAVFQFGDHYIAVEFQPVAKTSHGKEIVPFVAIESRRGRISVRFAISTEFPIIRKKNIWLGFGKREKISTPFSKGEKISFRFRIVEKKGNWKDYVMEYFRKNAEAVKISNDLVRSNISRVKYALWRAWDEKFGTFAQLPLKNVPGFSLVNFAWGLSSYEAVNMNYFRSYYEITGDDDYIYWSKRLENLFLSGLLFAKPEKGKGMIWHELTKTTDRKIYGIPYLYTGYAGYPGGQATIALNLANYGLDYGKPELLKLAKLTMDYIVSTQNPNGSWPAAIKHRFEPPIRSSYEKLKTTGGSAECVRALLLGSKIFKDKKYEQSALMGMRFLSPGKGNSCIGANVLRDIGKDEKEGLSSVYVVNAFLDAFEQFGEKDYLEKAKIWAAHMLTWFYMWESVKLKLKGYFHPISLSITPRISPYESILAVTTFIRLYRLTGDELWKRMAVICYKRVSELVEKDGGLCECFFPDWLDGIDTIPMEQTFATAELLKASIEMAKLMKIKLRKMEKHKIREGKKNLNYLIKDGVLEVLSGKKMIMRFDPKNFIISLNGRKIELSIYNPYGKRNRLAYAATGRIKEWLPFFASPEDIKDALWGISHIKGEDSIKFHPYSKIRKTAWGLKIIESNPFTFTFISESKFHKISGIARVEQGRKAKIVFDPLEIRTLGHGINCRQVLFPVSSGKVMAFFDYDRILRTKGLEAYDISLKANWTHHGLFRQRIAIVA